MTPPDEFSYNTEAPDDWWMQIEEPDDDPLSAVRGEERAETPGEVEDFWKARPVLEHIHTFARSRMVPPWSVLGAVLCRVVTATPPSVQLPPLIGGHASLNLLVCLVGPSGEGKDASQKAAADCLDLGEHANFLRAQVGSGEGLSHMFMRETKEGPEQYNTKALIRVGEIDTLAALKGRQSSTIMPQLRQAVMGEDLGFFYVDQAKRMMVREHSYRLCVIAGVQPRRSATLLDDADGGTPQRVVWLPVADPDAPDIEPEEPTPVRWIAPAWQYAPREYANGADRHTMNIPAQVAEIVKQARRDRRKGNGDALDGHALLTREKVACALAILEGRTEMTMDDWALSGDVMQVSDRARQACVQALAQAKREGNHDQAVAEAQKTLIIQDTVDERHEQKIRTVCASVKRLLEQNDRKLSGSKLRGKLGARGPLLDDALVRLEAVGEVVVEETTYRGQKGRTVILPQGVYGSSG